MAWIRLAVVLSLWIGTAAAQAVGSSQLRSSAERAPDLAFPTEPTPLTPQSLPAMALYKPDGPGPFPALVLYHQCGGLSRGAWRNMSMLDWARQAVQRGYVALVIDVMGPRGIDTLCYGPKGNVVFARGVKDAFQAADVLRSFDFVDKTRIGLAGYSWGAMVGILSSGRTWAESLGEGRRFAAVVSFYPGCFQIRPPNAPAYDIVAEDIDRPLLVMMGGQDTETPAKDCQERLDPLKAAGAPIEMHLYPDATHCWDCANLDGRSRVDVRGNTVVYRHDPAVTRDSAERMFDFLARSMP